MSNSEGASADFELFTSLRYDPILLDCAENSSPTLNFEPPSRFYMLVYHRDRMLEASQYFDWGNVANTLKDGVGFSRTLLSEVESYQAEKGSNDEPLKVRVLFNRAGELKVDCVPVPRVPLETLYPKSLNPPSGSNTTCTQQPSKPFKPSPLTGGALELGPEDRVISGSTSKPIPPTWLLTLDTEPTPSSPHTALKTTHRPHYDAARARALPSPSSGPGRTGAQSTTTGTEMYETLLYNECDEITEGSLTSVYFFRGGRWVTPPVGVPADLSRRARSLTSASSTDGTSDALTEEATPENPYRENRDEGELRRPFPGRWGHSVRSEKVAGGGGQRGTTRRWALQKALCVEEPVGKDTVRVGEGVWVSNGVRGFGYGTVIKR
ncbi:Aminodeoxychorismate lyase [Coniosporium apollinis]|uniref:Aminodeoxychorismate lyase n=1 Tax=Coniosporium apollinis TaxID=61459 RepID=A0ABQ9NI71_9PEZI|nr:Aminodeoxychorismate lyase [Coniosporium apollinis]